jgi:hypothetical protein
LGRQLKFLIACLRNLACRSCSQGSGFDIRGSTDGGNP